MKAETTEKKGFENLNADVVRTGLCTSCGTCAGVCATAAIEMDYTLDEPLPKPAGKCTSCGACYDVCPGKDVPLRDMDRFFLGRERDEEKDPIGLFKSCYRGWSTDPYVKSNSSSGGVVTGVCSYALENDIVDAVIMAGWSKDDPTRCRPIVTTSPKEVGEAARSAMVIVPNNALLAEAVLKEKHSRIGVVGLPCHVHGLRKLQMRGQPKKLAGSIKFIVGLFCAATYYWEGIRHLIREFTDIQDMNDIVRLDYRGGQWPGGMYAVTSDAKVHFVASKHDYTWHFLGASTFKRDRCIMCTDFAAELADVSCGDIFQPVIPNDRRIVATVTRTDVGEDLVRKTAEAGYIRIEPHDPKLIPASGLGWEAKKHAGMYRLVQRREFGWPTPDYQYEPRVVPLNRKLTFPS
ncbi:MAG: Coenzyme F420 hydrogenase/dehydrogenase, beta subunit C-terminal domain [Bacillota bacterium]